ncbi:MAG: LON peptidase substrate-binding domain-containing protein [Lentisphaeraceae bacterium]|nr:LON peptidase substrate-binding domain-containing protein [Lentisphaeraceae bacterium]
MSSANKAEILPIFPLGDFVLFPGAVTEFYIFEPRYVQLIEYAIDSTGKFCFGTLVGNWKELYHESPDLFPFGCICTIEHYEKHPDGRYSIIVKGLQRARLSEIPSEQLYRMVKAIPEPYIDDLTEEADDSKIIRSFIKRFMTSHFSNIDTQKADNIIDEMNLSHFLPVICFECKTDIQKKLDLLSMGSLKKIFLTLKKLIENE